MKDSMRKMRIQVESSYPHEIEWKTTNKILIAEDDEDTAFAYKLALEKAGYKVTLTENGEDCAKVYLEEFQNLRNLKGNDPTRVLTHLYQPFGAVILDYRLPGRNGMEAAKEILAINPHQRIIFASAYIREAVKDSAKELKQIVELLQKPFSSQVLLDTISDRRIYNQLRKYNIDLGVLKKAEFNHEQLAEILNLLKKFKKGGSEEEI